MKEAPDPYAFLDEAVKADPTLNGPDDYEYWIDLDSDERSRAELNEWIVSFNLGAFITNQLIKPAAEWNSHVISSRTHLAIILRILPVEVGGSLPTRLEFLAAVKSARTLVTYNTTLAGSNLTEDSIKYIMQDGCLHDGSSDALLLAWLEFHLKRTMSAILRIRDKGIGLVARMDADPASVSLGEILHLKDQLYVSMAVAEEQTQCMILLKEIDDDTSGVDFRPVKGSMALLISTASSTERMALRLEKRILAIRSAFDSFQQDKINHRLAILTVVSAVFMPLTFIAGIYGMNFENMPELEYEYSYFILMGSLAALTASMLYFFYINGWFA